MSEVDLGEMKRLADGLRHNWNSNPAGRPDPLYMPHGGPLRAADVLEQAADELERLRAYRKRLQGVVDLQAEDEALWFIAQTAPEAHLQEELRRLHWHIEREE